MHSHSNNPIVSSPRNLLFLSLTLFLLVFVRAAESWSSECNGQEISELLDSNPQSSSNSPEVTAREQAQKLQAFFNRCNERLARRKIVNSVWELARYRNLTYDFHQNPYARPLNLTLPGGTIIEAFLVIQPDENPKPLVLIKCGALCNLDPKSDIRVALAHAFDESPFNVLLLGSTSGSDYQLANRQWIYGGAYEGLQLIQIAQLMLAPTSPLYGKITSLHGIGLSLGGHAMLYASLYNRATEEQIAAPLFSSFMAFCPAISLEQSVRSFTNGGVLSQYIRRLIESSLTPSRPHNSTIENAFLNGNIRNPLVLPDLVAQLSLEHLQQLDPPLILPAPLSHWEIKSPTDYWGANDFLKQPLFEINRPLLVVSAMNDPIILAEENILPLKELITPTSELSNIGAVQLSYGSHCTFESTYDWNLFAAMVRSYIQTHEPQRATPEKHSALMAWPKSLKLDSRSRFVDYRWKAQMGSNNLELEFRILRGYLRTNEPVNDSYDNTGLDDIFCSRYWLSAADQIPKSCMVSEKVSIPYALIKSPFLKTLPLNPTHAEIISRHAQATFRIEDSRGGKLAQRPGPIIY